MDKNQALLYYDQFIEEMDEQVSEETRAGHEAYRQAFDEYLNALQEDLFQKAFRYGYEQGLKAAGNSKTA